MERHILHLDIDTFFVSVERLRNSNLVGKPILIGGSGERGVVAACSYEARRYGVHSAMSMKFARHLCPEAIVIQGDMSNYSEFSDTVTQIISEKAPAFEKASIDEFYLDVSGMDKYFGTYKWSSELRSTIIHQTGLPISFGLSINKVVSKIATGEAKPNGQKLISDGLEKSFLAPLSVKKIPMIGEKTYISLRNMGVNRIHTIQEMDMEVMERVFGINGITIWKRANGIDSSPVVPYSENKSISTQDSFSDTIDIALLRKKLSQMSDKLSFQLRHDNKLTTCVTVRIRYSDMQYASKQFKVHYTSAEQPLTEKALEAFNRVHTKRMMINQISLKYSGLISGNYQLDLFNQTITQTRLNAAMDSIRNRFGKEAVVNAKNF